MSKKKKKMDKKSIFYLLLEAMFFLLIIFWVHSCYSNKLDKTEQNYKAATAEMEKIKLENGSLLYERDLYVLKEKELEEKIHISNEIVKELKKKLDSSIAYIAKLEGEVRIDSIVIYKDTIIQIAANEYSIPFSYKNKWVNIMGKNNITAKDLNDINTLISNINMDIPLNVGITEDNKIFVQTDNPYVNFNEINGAVLDKTFKKDKKAKFTYGVFLGMGLNYGFFNKKIDFGPTLNVGLGVSF